MPTSGGFGKLSCTNSKSNPLAEEDSYTIAEEEEGGGKRSEELAV